MPEAARLRYEQEAGRRRCEIVDALAEKRSAVLAELQVRAAQELMQMRDGLPQRMSSCRWSESTKDAFNAMYETTPHTRSHIKERRATAVQKIMPPPQAVQDAFEAMLVPEPQARAHAQPWLSFFCTHRRFFANCAMRWRRENTWRYEKFVFAMQNPRVVFFRSLSLNVLDAGPEDLLGEIAELRDSWRWCFLLGGTFSFSDEPGAIDEDSPVEILCDCFLQRHMLVASDADWVSLATVEEWLGADDQGSGERGPTRADGPKDMPDWVDFPWVLDLLEPGKEMGWPTIEKRVGALSSTDDATRVEAEWDVDVEEVLERLHERRLEWAALEPVAASRDFVAFLRGGADTARRTGVAWDFWRGSVTRGTPTEFAIRFGLGRTSDFSIAAYGENVAHTMASWWAHKMQYYYDVWTRAGRPAPYVWDAAALAAYEEPISVLRIDEATASDRLLLRMQQLRRVRPRGLLG